MTTLEDRMASYADGIVRGLIAHGVDDAAVQPNGGILPMIKARGKFVTLNPYSMWNSEDVDAEAAALAADFDKA